MDSLPNECLTSIFENFENNNRLLYKCSLISRKWCQINVPILWSEPGHHFKDIRVIEILLLSLNDEEQFQLVPFMFDLPKKRNLSFNYSSLINSVLKIDLNTGVRNWLLSTPHCNDELQVRIVDSLITMLLRSNENIKRISIDGFNTNLIFNHIHNIHYLDLCELTRETVNDLISLLNNHKTLKTLRLFSNRTNIIESDQLENLLSTITNNLKTLYISNHRMGRQEGKMFAKFLRRNTGLTSLTLKGDSSWDPSTEE
ncbi:hypothetical protein F8M41_007812 [Gigaspora margarita]|uniref:F-box domain-containing protein n=1 Tax=Gigaspora margarita TaxID=4874 RepID=A0A8H4AW60_GIGMA|nr:hypothetical protein F8M41_007812 [Gigaspora margarita]